MWNESLESKCRYFQELANYKLMPNSYVIFHIDGRSFSKFCKRFKKPYDSDFIDMMNETAKYLCEKISNIKLAYIQSDEITLISTDINQDKVNSDMWFGNRICKLCSIAASLATSKFIQLYFEKYKDIPLIEFDCKVWNVPTLNDAFAWVLYRQIDCIRNSKQMLGHTYLSHSEMLNKNTDEIISMVLEKKNIDWNKFNDGMKYGRFIFKEIISIKTEYGEIMRNKYIIHDGFEIASNVSNKNKIVDIIKV